LDKINVNVLIYSILERKQNKIPQQNNKTKISKKIETDFTGKELR
jgi:hypothetical protein